MYSLRHITVIVLAVSSAAAHAAPVQLAARVELRAGSILIGLRNTTAHPMPVTLRILAADGASLPISTLGLVIPPRADSYRRLPVRDVMRDVPLLDCLLVYAGTNISRQRVACNSGALFRDSTAMYVITNMPHRASYSVHSTVSGARELRVRHTPVLTELAPAIGSATILPWLVSNNSLYADVVIASGILARTMLVQRSNGQGDIALVLLTDILAPGIQSNHVPALEALIPASLLSNNMIAARRSGSYIFTSAASLADAAVAARFSGPAVDEWSLITPRDWFIIALDAAQLALEPRDHGLHVRITSRAPWLPPFIPGRSHAVQWRLHLPVGVQ